MSTLKKRIDKEVDEIIAEASTVKNPKVAISIKLDSDIYMELKKQAGLGKSGGKYQRLMNDLLRRVLFEECSIEDRLTRLEKKVL